MKMSKLTLLAMVTLTALGVSAHAADKPIKIGSILSTTGPGAYLGEPEANTLQMYVEAINKDGGILGRDVELVVYDDGTVANKANSFAKRLLFDDKVDVFIGGTTTGSTMSVIPMVEKEKIPFISLAGGVVIVDPVKEWVFKTPHTDRMAVEKIYDTMKEQGITKIGLLTETSGFGQSGKKEAEHVAPEAGVEILINETYGAKDTDVSPQLTKMKNNKDIQAVLVIGLGQGPALVTRNYRQLDVDLPLYHAHGVCSDEFIKLTAKDGEGVIMPCTAVAVGDLLPDDDPQKEVVVNYMNEYKDRWGDSATSFGAYAYDGLMLYKDAVERAGTTDGAKVRDAIEQTDGFVGTTGIFEMSPTDHLGLDKSAFRMVEIEDGHWKLIE